MLRTSTDIKSRMKDGKPVIDVNLKGEANIADVECQVNLQDPAMITELEKKAEHDVQDKMRRAIKRAQNEYQSDVFGFGEVFYRQNVKDWNKMKNRWDEIFATDLEVNLKVDVQIRRLGTLNNSYMKEMQD
nr:Ger(x)C family spore germination C-terminal domain-containing protein [Priestia flexa]WEZ07751.1 Ger(x)C family spore germination C-terminal domain-containing protein [Priestia flexa]